MPARSLSLLAGAVLLGAGIATGGWFVGHGFALGRSQDRHVTVKGLAEREVRSDLALWPLRFVATGNELATVERQIAIDGRKVRGFLERQGIPAASIEVSRLEVTDLIAQAWRQGPVDERFIVAQTLMVRSSEVELVETAHQAIAELIAEGVVLSSDGGPSSAPVYLFTGLNDIKPDMIAVATRNARASAEQFAADAGSRLAGIRRANQGVFEILPRDQAPGISAEQQVAKTVRVVSTIDYLLED
ncbi:SIMPL domain-containing protein [Geminicoccaceae bacterium 1502E]|nr:SIMPL domain-containing protein [Geminicoccaceae bacterium 1502E]